MTLSPYDASTAIHHVATIFETLDLALDSLVPKVSTSTAERLLAIRELSAVNPAVALQLRRIAQDCEEEGMTQDEALEIEAAEAEYEKEMMP